MIFPKRDYRVCQPSTKLTCDLRSYLLSTTIKALEIKAATLYRCFEFTIEDDPDPNLLINFLLEKYPNLTGQQLAKLNSCFLINVWADYSGTVFIDATININQLEEDLLSFGYVDIFE